MKKNDFNSIFWRTISVNNKVYQYFDIFPSMHKEASQIKYKNIRDKEADEKSYERFLNNKLCDVTKNNDFKINEILIFTKLLRTSIHNDEDYDFFFKQFFNLIINYFSFSKSSPSNKKLINLFAFQLAFIIEYMRHHKLNTKLFELSVQSNSIEPFLHECKKIKNCKTDLDLATELSNKHEELIDTLLQNSIYLKTITPDTFKKYISSWKSNKSLPILIHIFTITKTLHKNFRRQTEALFIQLLIMRSLLYLEREFNISIQTKKKFIDKLVLFQTKIEALYNKSDTNKIVNLQNEHLRNFSLIFEVDSNELLSIVGY